MPRDQGRDRLSWGDALFLYLERQGMPLNIASVNVFEGKIPLAACRSFVESKLPLVPRYLQRVAAPPFNLGLPVWEDDPEFDVRHHIRQVRLKRGTEAELKAVAGTILSTSMDRQRPLWDIILVRGLKGDRTGLIARVHHCLADGMAGVGLMNVIMDQSSKVADLPAAKSRLRAVRPADAWASLVDLWMSSYSNLVQRALTAQAEVLDLAEKIAGDGRRWPAGQLLRLLPELMRPTERLFFNVTCRGPQKYACTQIPMEEIQDVREACDVTHNDVVLTVVTGAIRRYAELHGDVVKKRLLRMMVPVNVRGDDNSKTLGNRISLLPVTIPLDIRSPRRLLFKVRERMGFLKRAHVAELVSLFGGLVGTFPPPLQAWAGPIASELPITPFNLVCTNVPGPHSPLYLLGHKMLDWYPYVPVGGDMALNCAVLSYNGTCYIGFSGDLHAAPDLGRLERFLQLSFTELKRALGVKRARKPTARSARNKDAHPAPALFNPEGAAAVRAEASPKPPAARSREPVGEDNKVPAVVTADVRRKTAPLIRRVA